MHYKFVVKITAALFILLCSVISPLHARTVQPHDISVPDGFSIEAVVTNLSAPTMIAFDDKGRMIIAESGYDGAGGPKISRIERDGSKMTLTKEGVFGEEVPVTAVAFYNGQYYVVHAGTVSIIQEDGNLKNIISDLPGNGDHQANQLVFQNEKMYLSIGTVTNSGVVGPDNAVFGWLNKPNLRNIHDVPCRDVILSDTAVFESDDISGHELPKTRTSAYSAFGQEQPAGTVIPGNVKCNGAVLRANPDGTKLEVVAWGLRNPYGLEMGPDNQLYITMHGFDARGSRPIENAWDCLYKIEEGAWYGFPDFACDVPVTDSRFKTPDQPQPQFVMANHPTNNPPKPIAKFNPHAATNGFTFASDGWGKPTDVFIALFGDFTPATGTVEKPQGVKIVKVDTTSGKIEDFIVNKLSGQASRHSAGGLEHPSDVTFGPDQNMYIADWGIARVSVDGIKLEQNSGVIWKVSRQSQNGSLPVVGIGILKNILLTLFFVLVTLVTARGTLPSRRFTEGIIKGVLAGLAMGVFTMFVASPLLLLPWYAPPRVLATLLLGAGAIANILVFDISSFLVGVMVLLVLTALSGGIFSLLLKTSEKWRIIVSAVFFGLTVWSLLQYFIFPVLQPLITEKGFPPLWYALSFMVFGLTLGISNLRKHIE